MSELSPAALGQLFTEARTQNAWSDEPVSEATLHRLYDLVKWGPTSANCCPGRFVFVTTPEAREKLAPHLSSGNRAKTLTAPVCVIIAHDMEFAAQLPTLFPHDQSARHWFAAPAVAEETAFRNSSLQGAYLLFAARALGLDCGPMSGFDKAGVDAAFFAGTSWRSNFLMALGHGKPEGVYPRNPRLAFDEACRIL
ncbi:malonic semialdehyde reductase [Phenylobacterium sp.]|uniref:malonic semialdehyde reductase n=1 Tax=Phenylobacterium sp. TaxID=1871053 RepID=UPI002FDA25B5